MRNKHKDKGYKRAAQNISGISMRYILELGKSSSILIGKFSSLVLFICFFLVACNEKGYVQRPLSSLEAVNDMANQSFQLDANKIRQHLYRMAKADRDSLVADARTRRYYRDGGNLLWVDRFGTDTRADSLLGLDNVSVSQVEFKSHIQFYNGIRTDDIHETIIKAAADLISENTPDYQYLAARLVSLRGIRGEKRDWAIQPSTRPDAARTGRLRWAVKASGPQ